MVWMYVPIKDVINKLKFCPDTLLTRVNYFNATLVSSHNLLIAFDQFGDRSCDYIQQ